LLSALEQQQEFIHESIPNLEDLLLTTVIGIQCKDGVVLGTDSQFTDKRSGTKSLTENKIHRINDFMILGGSGDVYQTNVLVESLQDNLNNRQYTDEELRKTIMKRVLAPLYKSYNPDQLNRSHFIHYHFSQRELKQTVNYTSSNRPTFSQLMNMKRLVPVSH
jgi:Proteasome subunit